jgi:hypothetical protein
LDEIRLDHADVSIDSAIPNHAIFIAPKAGTDLHQTIGWPGTIFCQMVVEYLIQIVRAEMRLEFLSDGRRAIELPRDPIGLLVADGLPDTFSESRLRHA